MINGLTDYSHPCQAMADYLTMLEVKGRIAGLKVAYIGDGNNVARSLMFLGAQLGADVWIASPPGYEPDNEAITGHGSAAPRPTRAVTITHDPELGGLRRRRDLHRRLGQHGTGSGDGARKKVFAPYQINSDLFAEPRRMLFSCIVCLRTAAMRLPTR